MNNEKLTILIDKYTNELNNRKENLGNEEHLMGDAERTCEERAISKNAEMVRDLKSLLQPVND